MPYGIIDTKLVFPGLAGLVNVTTDIAPSTAQIKLHKGSRRGGLRFGIFVPQALAGATGLTVELKESADGTTFTSFNPPLIYTVNAAAVNDVDNILVESDQPYLGVQTTKTGSFTGSGAGMILCYLTTATAGVTGVINH